MTEFQLVIDLKKIKRRAAFPTMPPRSKGLQTDPRSLPHASKPQAPPVQRIKIHIFQTLRAESVFKWDRPPLTLRANSAPNSACQISYFSTAKPLACPAAKQAAPNSALVQSAPNSAHHSCCFSKAADDTFADRCHLVVISVTCLPGPASATIIGQHRLAAARCNGLPPLRCACGLPRTPSGRRPFRFRLPPAEPMPEGAHHAAQSEQGSHDDSLPLLSLLRQLLQRPTNFRPPAPNPIARPAIPDCSHQHHRP